MSRLKRAAVVALVVVLLAAAGVVALNVIGVTGPFETIAPRLGDEPPPSREADGRRRYIAEVTSFEVAKGTVYRVRPARVGRVASRDELDVAWQQAVRRGVPDRRGLREQFLCHPLSVVARAKRTWDLETWRPTVGLLRTILAGCNP